MQLILYTFRTPAHTTKRSPRSQGTVGHSAINYIQLVLSLVKAGIDARIRVTRSIVNFLVLYVDKSDKKLAFLM